ncbi:MAG TPA: vitamin K epoxide reductase family protein [Acidimicrobiales bacterium]|nr:vitamin K epoxide reductase family protein [Acidimicrobiales bacterium]
MPKPPTSQRGRPARTVAPPPPAPAKRPWLRRFVAGQAVATSPLDERPAPAPTRRVAGDRVAWMRPVGRGGPRAAAPSPVEVIEESPADDGDGEPRVSWRAISSTLLCLAGLGIAVYETIAHYANFQLLCSSNSTFNCEQVTHSAESMVFGIPVAVLGLVFFVPMLALCSPWAWRWPNRYVAPARLAGLVVGVGFVFYLIYCELFVIGKICLWCSGVHLVTLALFLVVATGWAEATEPARRVVDEGDDFNWWGSPVARA